MVALVRGAPCPRLLLRSTKTTTSSKTTTASSPSPSSPPRQTRASVAMGTARCYVAYHVAASACLRAAATSPAAAAVIPPPQQHCRSFHHTASPRHDLARRNHYERLQVSPTASPADIKKSFYRLSKAHHPDANRNDPSAAHTFSLLSESYTLLSDPSRRAAYDRDHLPTRHHHHHQHHSSPPHGSYHSSSASSSSSAAGGRPASGLSKRRGTFRGPPPSFYRNGGWGAHAEKRQEHAHGAASAAASAHYTNYEGSQDPGGRARRDEDEVPPHFDKDAHRRTHEHEDARRWARRRQQAGGRALDEEGVEFEPQASLGAHFAIVLGILGATVLVPVWYWNAVRGRRKTKEY